MQHSPSKNLLLIFTRNPELGKCKTRLAATIGNQAALEVYKFLLVHTVDFTKTLHTKKVVYYSEVIWENDIWDTNFYDKKLQLGNDLGERMANAFQSGFASGFEKIMIIGSDMYDLSTSDLENAFTALDDHDYVIGPATDGGYYLLGMKTYNPSLFAHKDWGTETVLEDTLADLHNDTVKLMEPRNDVDLYDDIKDIEAFRPFLNNKL
ncbi:MAG: TIGR04282 family arsenosugar biosynthesis glycosyltransferase [Bacteroidota bacterium]